MCVKNFCNCQSNCCVTVMSAGVHDPWIGGCILRFGIFCDGESVHVEAQKNNWTGLCTFEQTNDPGLANPFRDFDAKLLEFLCHDAACANFIEAEFRVHVEVAPQ